MSEEREKLVDEVLDKALAGYSQAEPRMGLEGRVLARLEEEKAAPARAGWWRWAWAPAAAALLIAGGLYLSRPRTQPPAAANVPVKVAPAVTPAVTPPPAPVAQAVVGKKPRIGRAPQAASATLAEARQSRFPAPQPLTEQDRLLLAYVRRQPQAAAEQAQASARPLAEMKIEPLVISPMGPEGDQQPQH